MPLTRLIYYSENQIDSIQGSVVRTLAAILSTSNRNNKPLGLTGALIFDDQWFLQVLEGERDKVWRTFERIREDERHEEVTIAELVEIEKKTFGNWWMGLATRNAKTEDVFAPFLQSGRFDPRSMSADQMMSLAVGLARLGLSRELASKDAA